MKFKRAFSDEQLKRELPATPKYMAAIQEQLLLAYAHIAEQEEAIKDAMILFGGTELCDDPCCGNISCKEYQEWLKKYGEK